MIDNDDSYGFLDREEIEFSHDGQDYIYWFFFRQSTITFKGGSTGTALSPQEAEITIHPEGDPSAVAKAILILYKAKTSGNIQIPGFLSKLMRILLSKCSSEEMLKEYIAKEISTFKTRTPIAKNEQVLKFLGQFPPMTSSPSEGLPISNSNSPETPRNIANSSFIQSLRKLLGRNTDSPSTLSAAQSDVDLAEKSAIPFAPAPTSSVLDSSIQSNAESQDSGSLTTPPPSTQNTPIPSGPRRNAKARATKNTLPVAIKSPLNIRRSKRRIETIDSDCEDESRDPGVMNVPRSTPEPKEGRPAKRPRVSTAPEKSSENCNPVEIVDRGASSERVSTAKTLDTNRISTEKVVDNSAGVGIQPPRQSSIPKVRDLSWPRVVVPMIKLKMAFERKEQTTSERYENGSARPLTPNSVSDSVSPRNGNEKDHKASERDAAQETPMKDIDVAQRNVVGGDEMMGTWEGDDLLISQILERQRQRKKDFDISLRTVKDENKVLRTESQDLKRTVNEKDNQLKDTREQRDKAVEELDRLRKQVAIREETNITLSNEKLRLEIELKTWKDKCTLHIAEKGRITEQLKKKLEDLQYLKKSLETEVSVNQVLSLKMNSVQRQAKEEKDSLIVRCEKAESEAKSTKALQLEAEEKTRQIEKKLQEREQYVREWRRVKEKEHEIVQKMFHSG